MPASRAHKKEKGVAMKKKKKNMSSIKKVSTMKGK
jgi:hypothetical protein